MTLRVKFPCKRVISGDLIFQILLYKVTDLQSLSNLMAPGVVFSSSNYCGAYTSHPIEHGQACLTNHPVGKADITLRTRGYTGPDVSGYSLERLEQITLWLSAQTGRATVDDTIAFLGAMPEAGRVNNPHTAFATIAMPQADPHTLWIAQQSVTTNAFHAFDVRTGELSNL